MKRLLAGIVAACACTIEDETKAIALNPSYIDAYFERASAFAPKGESEKALADLRTAVKLLTADDRRRDKLLAHITEREKQSIAATSPAPPPLLAR